MKDGGEYGGAGREVAPVVEGEAGTITEGDEGVAESNWQWLEGRWFLVADVRGGCRRRCSEGLEGRWLRWQNEMPAPEQKEMKGWWRVIGRGSFVGVWRKLLLER